MYEKLMLMEKISTFYNTMELCILYNRHKIQLKQYKTQNLNDLRDLSIVKLSMN